MAMERSSPPESQLNDSRRERRKDDAETTSTTNPASDKIPRPKKVRFDERRPRVSDFPEVREEANHPSVDGNAAGAETQQSLRSGGQESRPVFRRPRLLSHADGANDSNAAQDLKIKLHDISQSKWIENPNDHSTEKIYLTIEDAPLAEMMTIAPSTFCWM